VTGPSKAFRQPPEAVVCRRASAVPGLSHVSPADRPAQPRFWLERAVKSRYGGCAGVACRPGSTASPHCFCLVLALLLHVPCQILALLGPLVPTPCVGRLLVHPRRNRASSAVNTSSLRGFPSGSETVTFLIKSQEVLVTSSSGHAIGCCKASHFKQDSPIWRLWSLSFAWRRWHWRSRRGALKRHWDTGDNALVVVCCCFPVSSKATLLFPPFLQSGQGECRSECPKSGGHANAAVQGNLAPVVCKSPANQSCFAGMISRFPPPKPTCRECAAMAYYIKSCADLSGAAK